MNRRKAYFEVSAELLCKLLKLPEGTNIERVSTDCDPLRIDPSVRFIVSSEDFPEVDDGNKIPKIHPMYRTKFRELGDVVEFQSWESWDV